MGKPLSCRVLGHDWSFGAEGRVVAWACARCGAEGGRKAYASEVEAQHLAAASDRRGGGPGAVLAARGGRVDRPPRRRR